MSIDIAQVLSTWSQVLVSCFRASSRHKFKILPVWIIFLVVGCKMDVVVSSNKELADALASAKGGDTIELAPGDYGSVKIDGKNYNATVTLKSAVLSNEAEFDSLNINNSSNIKIDSVHVSKPTESSSGSAIVTIDGGSHHIEFTNSEVNGPVNGRSDARGVYTGDAANIIIDNNYVHHIKDGIVSIGSDDLTIRENTVDYVSSDGMKFAGINTVLIENNTLPRIMTPGEGAHNDYIQFQGASQNIIIRGNVGLPETEFSTQGIFMTKGPYSNVLIENNILYHGNNRGITVHGDNVKVVNNTMLTFPDYGGKASLIDTNGINQNNVTGFYKGEVGSNIKTQYVDPNGTAYYNDLYVNAMKGAGITIEDLRPVPGGLVDFGSGKGAEQRISELLNGQGSSSGPPPVDSGDSDSGNSDNGDPDAGNDSFDTDEDASVTIQANELFANDSDPDGDSLTITSVGNASNGTTSLNSDGSLTYTPAPNFDGQDSFTYTISDGNGGSDTATVNITVNPSEDAPVASNDTVLTQPNTAKTFDVRTNDVDPDGDALSVDSFTQPQKGQVTLNGDGSLTYTPNTGFVGNDMFSYAIGDGKGGTDSATVNVTVSESTIPAPLLSDGPHAFSGNPAQAVVLQHSAPYELASGTVELSFEADTLSGLQGLLSKDASYFGTGGHLGVFLEGNDIRIRMQSTSDETDFKIPDVVKVGQPHHLALTFGSSGLKVYLDGTEVGTDSWTGGLQGNAEPIVIGANQWASSATTANKLQDGFDGAVSEVNLYAEVLSAEDVAALATGAGTGGGTGGGTPVDPNDAPEAVNDRLTLDEDTWATVDVLANDTDPDGDALSVQSFTQGDNGAVAENADGTLKYTPKSDFNGLDSFNYTISDGNGGADSATVDVTVKPVGGIPSSGDVVVSNAPELLAALANAIGGETIVLESNDYGDVDLTNLQFSNFVTLTSASGQGAVFHTLDIEGSQYLRLDSIHVANSTNGAKSQGFVNIVDSENIELVNSDIHGSIDGSYSTGPELSPSAYGLEVSSSAHITIANNTIHDAEHGAVFFGVTDLEVSDNTVNDIASDSFKFGGVSNGLIENNIGATRVHPNINDHADFIQFQGDGSDIVLRGNVLLPQTFPNGQVYQGIFLKDGQFDNVVIEDNLIYTNTVNAIFVASDSGTGDNITLQNNTVLTPPNATKWGNADIRLVSLQGAYKIQNNVADRIVDQVNNGQGSISGNREIQWENPNGANYYNDFYVNAIKGTGATIEDFAPVPGSPAEYLGAHERILELLGSGGSGSGDPNNAPVANDDVFATNEDAALNGNVLADNGNGVDNDPDGDALTVNTTPASGPANGALTLNADGTFTYGPNADFTGEDSFSYTVSDGNGGTDTATVVVTVNAVGGEPNASDIPSPLLSVGSNDFNGSRGDAVVVSHDASYELTSGTFEVEFSADQLVSRQGLLTKDAKYNGDGGHFLAFLEDDDIYVRMQNASTQTEVRVEDVIKQGQDHHLAITFGTGGLKLYLDGTEVASNGWTGGLQGNAEPIVVGANQWSSSPETADKIQDPFNGTISEVNLYGQILSEQNIANLANGDAGPVDPPAETTTAPTGGDGAAETQSDQDTANLAETTADIGFLAENAGFGSTFGFYDPLLGDATVVVPNATDGIASTEIQRYVVPENVEFFLVPNGAANNPGLVAESGYTVTEDAGTWKVLNSAGQALLGTNASYEEQPFALFTEQAKNPDGLAHAVLNENELSWEDILGGGDSDFDDVTFFVDVNPIG